ncbi:MAG: dTMP kinase [Notoacmeibacter sp.]
MSGENQLRRGLFITFEGGEGSGKSTQARMLAENLQADGLDTVVTREPGGSPAAEIVREVLLSGAAEKYGPELEAVLFSIARRDHVDTVIRPAIERGAIVLCDRFLDSTRAYQGAAGALPPDYIAGVETIAIDGLMPDLTFLLDIPVKEGLERADARRAANVIPDRFEKEAIEIHEARRRAYLAIAVNEPDRFVLIPANRDMRLIANEITLVVRTHIAALILRQDAMA